MFKGLADKEMPKHFEFAERLNSAMDKSDHYGTITAIAKELKITFEAVRRYTLGTAMPRDKNLVAIAKLLRVSPWYLKFGEDDGRPKYKDNYLLVDSDDGLTIDVTPSPLIEVPAINGQEKQYDLYFTKYSATFSMGDGVPAELEHDEIIGQLGVSREWANRYLHKATAFNKVTLITGLGDSMVPTYSDGETLFLDESVNEIKLDAVYAFKYEDTLYIKRIQRQKGVLKVISDNKSYDTWTIEPHELENLRVIGRIIHGCRIFDV